MRPVLADVPSLVAQLFDDKQKGNAARTLSLLGRRWDLWSKFWSALVLAGAVEPLVQLLRSPGSDAADAARALARLSMNNAVEVGADGAIPRLVEMLRLGDDERKWSAAMALRNIASDGESLQAAVASAGAIPPLVELLRGGGDGSNSSARAKKHAARALLHLMGSVDMIKSIVRAGAISPFVVLLRHARGDGQVFATAGLGMIASTGGEYQLAVARAGAIPPLIQMMQHAEDYEVTDFQFTPKETAVLTLGSLSEWRGNKDVVKAVKSAGAVPLLVGLLRRGVEGEQVSAAEVLGNLIRRSRDFRQAKDQAAIAGAGAISALIEMLQRAAGLDAGAN